MAFEDLAFKRMQKMTGKYKKKEQKIKKKKRDTKLDCAHPHPAGTKSAQPSPTLGEELTSLTSSLKISF